jgi:hypothetical protein
MAIVTLRKGKTYLYGALRITAEDVSNGEVRLRLRHPRRGRILRPRPKMPVDTLKNAD